MYPSDAELKEIIADAENKVGDYHALIMSKQVMIAAINELLILRQCRDEFEASIDVIDIRT